VEWLWHSSTKGEQQPSTLGSPGEPLIEVARESVAIRLCERWRTSADNAARTQGVHEVAHGENAPDRVR
jgi:hypothetical protein